MSQAWDCNRAGATGNGFPTDKPVLIPKEIRRSRSYNSRNREDG